ncbi:MAG TPA: DUF6036 family nucleotidyltransferase [Candidatus Baltobacteraceae bacterium]|nr:DUF6036 family nucleotidyltransferase [Candidatus Baltobacteraceae bacterium]
MIDLLHALNAEGAKYLLVGGYAFAFHGRIRATKDVDIFIGTDPANAQLVWRALQSFGAPLAELRPEDLTEPETFFVMGRAPHQIDIITTIDGVSFEEAWQNRVDAAYGDEPTHYISKDDLVANKTAAGRPQDLADVAYLKGTQD